MYSVNVVCVDWVPEGVSVLEVGIKDAGVVVSIHSLADGVPVEVVEPDVVAIEGVIAGVSLNSCVVVVVRSVDVVARVDNSVPAVVSIEVETSEVSVVVNPVVSVDGVCDIVCSVVVVAVVSAPVMVDVVSENGVAVRVSVVLGVVVAYISVVETVFEAVSVDVVAVLEVVVSINPVGVLVTIDVVCPASVVLVCVS